MENSRKIHGKLGLFITGCLQVLLVSFNVYQIANGIYLGAVIIGFSISAIWTFNVKNVVFGTNWDRVIYSMGSAVGTFLGMVLAQNLYSRN